MNTRHALWSDSPIGAGLGITGGGRTLATTVDLADINRTARSDIAVDAGVANVEMFLVGDEATTEAVIGIVKDAASLSTYVGGDAHGVGWRLDTGQILVNGSAVASGLDPVGKGEVLGIQLILQSASTASVTFYRWALPVYTHTLSLGDAWRFAASIAADVAGGTAVYVNTGNQGFHRPGASDGWLEQVALPGTLRLATRPYLSLPTDAPPNTRWEGRIDAAGAQIRRSVTFWPWANRAAGTGVGRLDVLDGADQLGTLLTDDWRGAPVTLRLVEPDGSLDDGELAGVFRLERCEVPGDQRKTLVLRDAMQALDVPVQTWEFPPYFDTVASRPLPLLLGACRNVPPVNIGELNDGPHAGKTSLWIADPGRPIGGVTRVRDKGDPLLPTTDWIYGPERFDVLLIEPPQGVVTIDASSEGSSEPSVLTDVWGGAAAPWSGTVGSVPTGWTGGASDSGDTPVIFDNGPGGTLGPLAVRFPNGTAGVTRWLKLGTIEPGKAYRWEVECFIPTGARLLGIGTGPDLVDLIQTISTPGSGVYRRTITNPFGSPQDVYLVATCDGGTGEPGIAYTWLHELDAVGDTLVPLNLAGIVGALYERRQIGNFVVADAQAIDTATGYAGTGLYIADTVQGGDETRLLRGALDLVLASYAAAVWQDDANQLRIARLIAPEDVDEGDRHPDILYADCMGELEIIPDEAPGLTTRAWYRPNWAVLDRSDLVTDYVVLPETERQKLVNPGQGLVSTGVRLAPRYRTAETRPPRVLLFENKADAQAELDRVCALYSANRDFYRVALRRSLSAVYAPGQVRRIFYPRHGLQAGKALEIVDVERNAVTGETRLVLWG